MATNEEIITELLQEFKVHRNAIMDMVTDLEKLKVKIDTLIPDNLEARYMRFFEEKVKSATEFFKTLLEMRKEIQKSLKDEIDLRRKMKGHDTIEGLEDLLDVRRLAGKVEDFRRKKEEYTDKSVEEARKATDEIASRVAKDNEFAGGLTNVRGN